MDGDLRDDLLLGNGQWAARYLVLASTLDASAYLSAALADAVLQDMNISTNGKAVGGDFDGDGLADVAVSSTATGGGATCDASLFNGSSGATHIMTSSTLRAGGTLGCDDATGTFLGVPTSQAGHGLAVPGDLDGDGRDDLVIGAAWLDTAGNNAGGVYLILSDL